MSNTGVPCNEVFVVYTLILFILLTKKRTRSPHLFLDLAQMDRVCHVNYRISPRDCYRLITGVEEIISILIVTSVLYLSCGIQKDFTRQFISEQSLFQMYVIVIVSRKVRARVFFVFLYRQDFKIKLDQEIQLIMVGTLDLRFRP